MSGLFRGLQGLQDQLSTFATEVLNEATEEEVVDAEGELQVVKKRVVDLESSLLAANRENERLVAASSESQEQAETAQLQLDSLNQRYRQLLEEREADIRRLQTEVQQLHIATDGGTGDVHSLLSSSPPLSPNQHVEIRHLRDEVKQLKAETMHWKNVVKQTEGGDGDAKQEVVELQSRLSEQTDKHQAEIASLQQAHFENVRALRTQYETRIAALQQTAEASTSVDRSATAADDWNNSGWSEDGDGNWCDVTATNKAVVDSSAERSADDGASTTANEELMTQLNEIKKKYDKLHDDRTQLAAERDRLAEQVELTRKSNRRASDELDTLQQNAADGEMAQKLDAAENRIVELELEVSSLRSEMDALDAQQTTAVEQLMKKKDELAAEAEEARKGREQHRQQLQETEEIVERLKAENQELTSAYNDLNDEFEAHKAEYGSVVTSNRDLNARIQSLKADLVEYEEKYERCKSENMATAAQLDKLTNDFERIRGTFEDAQTASSECDARLAAEVKRLQEELTSSQQHREKLVADIENFSTSITHIDGELTELRASNRRLMDENMELHQNMESMEHLKGVFTDTGEELESLRVKLKEFQLEQLKQEQALRLELQENTERVEQLTKETVQLTQRAENAEAALQRYRVVVGQDAADIVEMKEETAEKKSPSDGGGSGDSNGWDKVGEWDQDEASAAAATASELATAAPLSLPVSQMELQMREALAAVTEKTEECEQLSKQLMERGNELAERDELLQHSFTELKGLESQLCECRDREAQLRANVQRLTVENASKDEGLQVLRDSLEVEQAKQTELLMQLNAAKADETPENTELQSVMATNTNLRDRLDNELCTVQRLTEEIEFRTVQLSESQDEVDRLLKERQTMAENIAALEAKTCHLSAAVEESAAKQPNAGESDEKLAEMQTHVNQLSADLAESRTQNADLLKRLAESEATAQTVTAEKQQLVTLVQQKHDETMRYYTELQTHSKTAAELRAQVEVNEQRMGEMQQQLEAATERNRALAADGQSSANLQSVLDEEHRRVELLSSQLQALNEDKIRVSKEVERLREHLVQMEDSYTREAVAAEERETELRDRLKALEHQSSAVSESAKDSTQLLQDQMEDLRVQLESLGGQRDTALLELSDTQRQLVESNRALTSLQAVVRDMEREQSIESAAGADRLQRENTRLAEANQSLSAEVERLKVTCADFDLVHGDLQRRVDDLTAAINQRDGEVRALEQQLASTIPAATASSSSSAGKIVDQDILRNLFLSYFTAPNDKRREVAHLLASVLGFSAEDIKKMDSGASSSWLGFLKGGGRPVDFSITEQFIKFLESESVEKPGGAQQAHALPTAERTSGASTAGLSQASTPGFVYSGNSALLGGRDAYELPTLGSPLRPPAGERSSDIVKSMLQD